MARRRRAAGKKRTYRRWRRSKWLQYNTLRTKMEYFSQIAFPQGQGPVHFVTENATSVTLGTMLNNSSGGTHLKEYFAYCTITGIRLDIVPHANNSDAFATNVSPVLLCYVPGMNQIDTGNTDFLKLLACDTALQLDPTLRQTRYFSLRGATQNLSIAQGAESGPAGLLCLKCPENSDYDSSPSWNMKVTLYVYWRYTKFL